MLTGNTAMHFRNVTRYLEDKALEAGVDQIVLPSVWSQETFVTKAGKEILGQMYTFPDKKGRELCLIPEGTAPVQELCKEWQKGLKQDQVIKVFYLSRCYRYEKPQAGRYREFWQFGVEFLYKNLKPEAEEALKAELLDLLHNKMLHPLIAEHGVEASQFTFSDAVKRGLAYYVEEGFEVEAAQLGAQKQIAGGGKYAGGIGFAIGVDRLLLSLGLQ